MKTDLTNAKIRIEISKLEQIKITLCDTPAFDHIQCAIDELKGCVQPTQSVHIYAARPNN